MLSNRPEFLTRAARVLGSGALCTCTAAPEDLRANVAWPGKLFGKAPFAKMKWFNEPASATQSGDQLVVRTKPKTDYWRHDYVTDNGHFLSCPSSYRHASVVLTREFSDWSTLRGITTREPLWWRIVRKDSSLEVFYSLDGKSFISTRLGYVPMPASVDAGIMCCSPEGAGFESTFDQIRLTH